MFTTKKLNPLLLVLAVPLLLTGAKAVATVQPAPSQGDSQYLQATATVQSTNPAIVSLAHEIIERANAETDQDKAKAIHDWMSLNIKYDSAALLKGTPTPVTSVDVLSEKKGVCYGHAILYAALARAAGIPTQVINGTVDSSGQPGAPLESHSWNEILVNGSWQVVDTTWDDMPRWKYVNGVPTAFPDETYFEVQPDLASRIYLKGEEVSNQTFDDHVAE